jgi:hypothetical protein
MLYAEFLLIHHYYPQKHIVQSGRMAVLDSSVKGSGIQLTDYLDVSLKA